MLTGKDLFEGQWPHDILESRRLFVGDPKYRKKRLAELPKNKLTDIILRLLSEDGKLRFGDLHAVCCAPCTPSPEERTQRPARPEQLPPLPSTNKEFIWDFYQNFHAKSAHTADHFPRTKRQSAMLQMAVDVILDIDEKREWFVRLLRQPMHRPYTAADFEVFLDTLLETVQQNDARYWDEALAAAWQTLRDKAMAIVRKNSSSA